MKKLSDIINEQFSDANYLNQMGGLINVQHTNSTIAKNLDDILSDIHFGKNRNDKVETAKIHQQNKLEMVDDINMEKFFRMLDIINCFGEFVTLYITDRKATKKEIGWYEKEINKSLKSVNYYVEQLAININPQAKHIEADMIFDIDNFETNVQLATYIKKSDEWKELKKLVKKDEIVFTSQPLTIRALCMVIIKKINKFIQVIK